MSDSDCSNCEKEDCPYYDVDYNCYVKTAKEIKSSFKSNDIKEIKDLIIKLDFFYRNFDFYDCSSAKYHLQNIVDYYKAKI